MLTCFRNLTSTPSKQSRQLAQFGETYVSNWLKNNDFKILELNWKSHPGEIDIIATKLDYIVFTEVKARSSWLIDPSLAISFQKKTSLISTAKKYILQNNIIEKNIRFDVALIRTDINGIELNYIENAFTEEI